MDAWNGTRPDLKSEFESVCEKVLEFTESNQTTRCGSQIILAALLTVDPENPRLEKWHHLPIDWPLYFSDFLHGRIVRMNRTKDKADAKLLPWMLINNRYCRAKMEFVMNSGVTMMEALVQDLISEKEELVRKLAGVQADLEIALSVQQEPEHKPAKVQADLERAGRGQQEAEHKLAKFQADMERAASGQQEAKHKLANVQADLEGAVSGQQEAEDKLAKVQADLETAVRGQQESEHKLGKVQADLEKAVSKQQEFEHKLEKVQADLVSALSGQQESEQKLESKELELLEREENLLVIKCEFSQMTNLKVSLNESLKINLARIAELEQQVQDAQVEADRLRKISDEGQYAILSRDSALEAEKWMAHEMATEKQKSAKAQKIMESIEKRNDALEEKLRTAEKHAILSRSSALEAEKRMAHEMSTEKQKTAELQENMESLVKRNYALEEKLKSAEKQMNDYRILIQREIDANCRKDSKFQVQHIESSMLNKRAGQKKDASDVEPEMVQNTICDRLSSGLHFDTGGMPSTCYKDKQLSVPIIPATSLVSNCCSACSFRILPGTETSLPWTGCSHVYHFECVKYLFSRNSSSCIDLNCTSKFVYTEVPGGELYANSFGWKMNVNVDMAAVYSACLRWKAINATRLTGSRSTDERRSELRRREFGVLGPQFLQVFGSVKHEEFEGFGRVHPQPETADHIIKPPGWDIKVCDTGLNLNSSLKCEEEQVTRWLQCMKLVLGWGDSGFRLVYRPFTDTRATWLHCTALQSALRVWEHMLPYHTAILGCSDPICKRSSTVSKERIMLYLMNCLVRFCIRLNVGVRRGDAISVHWWLHEVLADRRLKDDLFVLIQAQWIRVYIDTKFMNEKFNIFRALELFTEDVTSTAEFEQKSASGVPMEETFLLRILLTLYQKTFDSDMIEYHKLPAVEELKRAYKDEDILFMLNIERQFLDFWTNNVNVPKKRKVETEEKARLMRGPKKSCIVAK